MNVFKQLKCDVLIIGAGPAGSTAARLAAQKGCSVILLERRTQIGLPVRCAEYVPFPVSRYLDLNCPGLTVQTVHAMQTVISGQSITETAVPGAIINRDRFDQGLADLAVQAGASIKTGHQAITFKDNQVVARGDKGAVGIHCRVIIGADGPTSQVGRWMGCGQKEFLLAAQYRVLLNKPLDHTRIYFQPDIKGGYGWLFPKGDRANLGLGLDPACKEDLKPLLNRFKQDLIAEGLIGQEILGQGGGLVPVVGLTVLHRDNMILAGDAAGTCHPITGAGVGNALISGELAGIAAAEAVRHGNHQPLQDYSKELIGLLGHSLTHGVKKRKAMLAEWDNMDFSENIRRSWIAFREYFR
jgi:geranylgeranyl reductase family protein